MPKLLLSASQGSIKGQLIVAYEVATEKLQYVCGFAQTSKYGQGHLVAETIEKHAVNIRRDLLLLVCRVAGQSRIVSRLPLRCPETCSVPYRFVAVDR